MSFVFLKILEKQLESKATLSQLLFFVLFLGKCCVFVCGVKGGFCGGMDSTERNINDVQVNIVRVL